MKTRPYISPPKSSRRFVGAFFFLLVGLFLFSGCGTVRYLKEDEEFLKKNKIYLKHAQGIHNKKKLKYELYTVSAQRPNRNFLGFVTRRWFHYHIASKSDTTKFNKWVLKKLAEKPAIYDTTLTQKSLVNMKALMSQKGYFDAIVNYKTRHTWRKKTIVKYYITPNHLTRIDSAFLECPDSNIYQILMSHRNETLLKPGAVLSLINYNQEVSRIVRLLRNRGYAKFSPSHIAALQVDTTGAKNIAKLEIYPYRDSLLHPVFRIGEVNVFHNFESLLKMKDSQDTIIDGLSFSPADPMEVKPKAIIRKITIEPNKSYNIDQIEETQKLLSTLNYYRSINISQQVSPKDSTKMNIKLYMTPKKKMSMGYLIDFNNSNVDNAGQNGSFLGIGGNINFAHRNIFRGSELLRLNLDAGLDIALKDKVHINSSNVSFSGDLFFPKYINTIPFVNIGKWLKNKQLDDFSRNVRKFSSSQISTNFSFVNIPKWYQYRLLKSNIGINYYGQNGSQMNVNNIGIEYFFPQPDTAFVSLMNNFIYLQRSFRKQLFTGFIFKNISYNSDVRVDSKGLSFQWGGSFDVSGLEILAINQTYNALTGKQEIFKLGRENDKQIEYAKFLKMSLHSTLKKDVTGSQTIGGKLTIGVAVPLSDTRNVPYVAHFFAGGPNSIRGWSIRELGPGGFKDPISSAPGYNRPYYQSGDLKLEMMSEWRFDIYWIFKGAIFLDAGNVWTIHKDPERPHSEITKDFYKQIAVSSGIGLRMDLTYFILRFDLGLKMRNPYPNDQNYYWINYGGGFRKVSLNSFNYNVQVGYPF
ncbi:MAG TPA: hypothetical protein ENK85_02195 [Saprospiraceae bacterium]|nr:hypothetical protein [Saprospiraceae bacterium]